MSIPEEDVTDVPRNRLSTYQHLVQMRQHIWERWNKEYISELQSRRKWKQTQSQLCQGDIVLIKEDNQPPLNWKMGKVITLHPGRDGVNRVATLQTQFGAIKRSFTKLCPLPFDKSGN